ncbi:neuromedin-U receptor 1-like [Scyliorhinus canicula]|uniref:neuromedin-U receptor 1-like n=1 Tax=Scyliorhinus canicula TaxID=7830 RepID=UPI0018F58AFD|nr:neuromedin-U receptor 1-like [Scyliorhinus canicula]
MAGHVNPCMMHIKSFNHNASKPRDFKISPSLQHLLIGSAQQEPSYVTIPVTVFYVLLFLFGVSANGLSILTLLRNVRLKVSAIRFYLLSLALADLLLLLTIPVTVYRYYWQYYPWLLSNPLCKLYFMIRQIYCATTSWTISAFTAERYIAICHPMWSITGLRQSRMVYLLTAIWVLSAITSVPFAIVYGQSAACILDYTATSQDKTVFYSTVCEMFEQEPFTIYKAVIQIRSILCFLVPLTVITIFHLLIFRHLSVNSRQREEMGLTHPWSGQCSNPLTSSGNLPGTERKALQLMGAVVVAFFVCNFPDTAASLMHIYTENWSTSVYTIYTWLKSYLSLPLWYVNSALDPILFCISSSSFRSAGRESLAPLFPKIGSSLNGHQLHVSCISLSQNWTRGLDTIFFFVLKPRELIGALNADLLTLTRNLQRQQIKLPTGVELNYRTNRNLSNLRCLQARSKIASSLVIKLQDADDACICAHSEVKLQAIANTFTRVYESMGLALNILMVHSLIIAVISTIAIVWDFCLKSSDDEGLPYQRTCWEPQGQSNFWHNGDARSDDTTIWSGGTDEGPKLSHHFTESMVCGGIWNLEAEELTAKEARNKTIDNCDRLMMNVATTINNLSDNNVEISAGKVRQLLVTELLMMFCCVKVWRLSPRPLLIPGLLG